LAKTLAFLTQTKSSFAEKVIVALAFEKNAKFFVENWQKSQKIVIITSIPDFKIFLRAKIVKSFSKAQFQYTR
jgi:phosphoribosylformimino-5-aminoimidazole carboxamide ribonucleotide (ProFAR) isomerase